MAPLPPFPVPSAITDDLILNNGIPEPGAFPIGVRFWPNYIQLLNYFLPGKILGRPATVIKEFDLYSRDPDQLPDTPDSMNGWKYFFVNLTAISGRETPNGYWVQTGEERAVEEGNRILGFFKSFTFYCREGNKETNWKMDELRLNPDLVEFCNSENVEMNNFVVCCVRPNDDMLYTVWIGYIPDEEEEAETRA